MEATIQDVARLIDGRIEGVPNQVLNGFAGIEDAGAGELTFLANPAYEPHLYTTKASAVLISADHKLSSPLSQKTCLIRVEDPYAAMAKLMQAFDPSVNAGQKTENEIHPSAVVHPKATLGQGVTVSALSFIGEGAVIGDRVHLAPGAMVDENSIIGSDCILGMRSIVGRRCTLGDHCILQTGATIGADGFGFAPTGDGYEKVPQLGNVTLGAHCEIGAGTTIDRATLGSTVLGTGVKLDNLIQVAHNVQIGNHTVIAAQTGIAGSTSIGQNCMIGGQVGINGHIHIAAGTKVAAKSGITASVKKENQVLQGNPALPIKQHQRIQIALRNIVREFESKKDHSNGATNAKQSV
jgi:UDP-3-O-[3-hydroxymyristoyl] glucosamine N-acyltransferase